MNLRFQIKEPTNAGSPNYICGGSLSAISQTNLSVLIKVNNTTILNTADLSSVVNGSTTTQVVLPTGFEVTVTLTKDNDYFKINIPIENIWEYCPVSFTISKSGYNTYINTYIVYGYDIGNDAVVTYNTDFNLILISNTYTPPSEELPYSSFIAYRKPFANKIYVYKSNSSQGVVNYYDEDDTLIASTSNYIINDSEIYDLYQTTSINYRTCTSSTTTIAAESFIPEFVLDPPTGDCHDDNVNIISNTNEASIQIYYDTLSTYYIDDVEVYPIYNQGINIYIYNIAGEVYVSNESMFYPNEGSVYDYTDHDLTNFQLPNIGNYTVQGCISVLGLYSSVLTSGVVPASTYYKIVSSQGSPDFIGIGSADNVLGTIFESTGGTPTWGNGALLEILNIGTPVDGTYYKILDVSGGADFTTSGASTTSVGLIFLANGVAPTWGTGHIAPVTVGLQDCSSTTVDTCHWFEVERTGCNTYTIYNRYSSSIDIVIEAVETSSTWESFLTTTTINSGNSLALTFSEDNVYRITINNGVTTSYYIIYNYCSLEQCLGSTLKELICCSSKCGAINNCTETKYHDFNSLLIQTMTMFSKLNEEYNFTAIYDSFDSATTTEMYSIKQLLDKLTDYCEDCDPPCNTLGNNSINC